MSQVDILGNWVALDVDEVVEGALAVGEAHRKLPEIHQEFFLVGFLETIVDTAAVATEGVNRMLLQKITEFLMKLTFLFKVIVNSGFDELLELGNSSVPELTGLFNLRLKILRHHFHLLRLHLANRELTLTTCEAPCVQEHKVAFFGIEALDGAVLVANGIDLDVLHYRSPLFRHWTNHFPEIQD